MTKVLPLIIGQAPARRMDGRDVPAFSSASGARLAKLAGVGDAGADLQGHFETMNLVSRYRGKQGKGDKFDVTAAKLMAAEILVWLEAQQPRVVLLMGRGVGRAFGCENAEYLRPWLWDQHTFVLFPHPSGVNRWWNEQWNVSAAQKLLQRVVTGRPLLYA